MNATENIRQFRPFSIQSIPNPRPSPVLVLLTAPNSRLCETSYTSTCIVECEDGYNRSGDFSQYSWGLNSTQVDWMFNGNRVTCSPGKMATNIYTQL